MDNADTRWKQRFSNYRKVLAKLEEAVNKNSTDKLSELEREGLIQRFEYTYELAWKTLQDLLRENGYMEIAGPNPVIAQAFQDGYLGDGHIWKSMKTSRELTSHTYNPETAETIAVAVSESYFDAFKALEKRLEQEL